MQSTSSIRIFRSLAFYYDHTAEFDARIARQVQELKALRTGTGESAMQKRLRALAKPV
jgi:hypothetical protein